ncbi:MAG: hypothetical protein HUJ27_05115 [Rhodobacteraceae bacterium]|nr:hypothetical protein [Paracoccaceae bacterium]
MTPEDIQELFTGADGSYRFARWGRPLAPIVFGVEDQTLSIMKGALEAVVSIAGHQMAETDPELGANLMVFFFRDWAELPDVPNLEKMIPDLGPLVERLQAAGANQYRAFRFDETGAIRACFLFIRMDAELSKMPAESLALAQAAQAMLLWSDRAFADRSPLAKMPNGTLVLRPEIAEVIRAAYDPVMPPAAEDPSHALRLFARLEATP